MNVHPVTLGIVGTGLIGTSIGLRARDLGWHVLAYDISKESLHAAQSRKAVDEIAERDVLYKRADTIVLSPHVSATLLELQYIADNPPAAKLIIDVSSVKAPIVRAAAGIPHFVATHPMAGAERSGAQAASSRLFSGKPWLYVPSGDRLLNRRAEQFITAMDAPAIAVAASEHDAIVALTSHVPQMIATLFAAQLKERWSSREIPPFCGPTANELLRLSRSSLAMWRDIFAENRTNVAAELNALAKDLQAAAEALSSGETLYVDAAFARARAGENV